MYFVQQRRDTLYLADNNPLLTGFTGKMKSISENIMYFLSYTVNYDAKWQGNSGHPLISNLWFTSLWLDTGQSLAGMTGRGVAGMTGRM